MDDIGLEKAQKHCGFSIYFPPEAKPEAFSTDSPQLSVAKALLCESRQAVEDLLKSTSEAEEKLFGVLGTWLSELRNVERELQMVSSVGQDKT